MKWLLVGLAFAGCAEAGPINSVISGISDAGPDSGLPGEPDASVIDAPPQQVTLAQTVTGAITPDNSIACKPAIDGVTRPNSYYRVFALADHDIATTLHVTEVAFAIQDATSGTGPDQPATIHIGTYAAAPSGDSLDLAQIRPIASVPIRIPDGRLTRMTVPVTADIPAATHLVVELAIPADDTVEHVFFIGSNQDGESKPGYLRAPTCALENPTTFSRISADNEFGEVDIILTVTGTT